MPIRLKPIDPVPALEKLRADPEVNPAILAIESCAAADPVLAPYIPALLSSFLFNYEYVRRNYILMQSLKSKHWDYVGRSTVYGLGLSLRAHSMTELGEIAELMGRFRDEMSIQKTGYSALYPCMHIITGAIALAAPYVSSSQHATLRATVDGFPGFGIVDRQAALAYMDVTRSRSVPAGAHVRWPAKRIQHNSHESVFDIFAIDSGLLTAEMHDAFRPLYNEFQTLGGGLREALLMRAAFDPDVACEMAGTLLNPADQMQGLSTSGRASFRTISAVLSYATKHELIPDSAVVAYFAKVAEFDEDVAAVFDRMRLLIADLSRKASVPGEAVTPIARQHRAAI